MRDCLLNPLYSRLMYINSITPGALSVAPLSALCRPELVHLCDTFLEFVVLAFLIAVSLCL